MARVTVIRMFEGGMKIFHVAVVKLQLAVGWRPCQFLSLWTLPEAVASPRMNDPRHKKNQTAVTVFRPDLRRGIPSLYHMVLVTQTKPGAA